MALTHVRATDTDPMNTLYYGHNLNILGPYIKDESVDLVYLDPPSSANRNYNVLFKDESGLEADSLEWLSADTWHWKGAASTYDDLIQRQATRFPRCSRRPRSFIGENQMMAYLVIMAVRLNLDPTKAAGIVPDNTRNLSVIKNHSG